MAIPAGGGGERRRNYTDEQKWRDLRKKLGLKEYRATGLRPVSFSLGRLYFRADNISADNGFGSLEPGPIGEPFQKFLDE